VKAIDLIAEKKVGRSKLAENLKVGEGTVRTIIERLKNADLMVTSKTGCTLTARGLRFWKEYKSIFAKKVQIEKNELTLANSNFAILTKNSGHKVETGVEQRDASVMAGAKGATTIIFKSGHLTIPSVSNDVSKDFPKAGKQIMFLQPKENDVIIIVSADSPEKAEYGALAAAWTLLD
jgi:predicted transcriptional regulator